MSYRIDYAPPGKKREPAQSVSLRPLVLTMLSFCLFCVLVQAFWQQGAVLLRRVLFGQSGDEILAAVARVADLIGQGQPLRSAAVSALREVLYGTG